MLPIPDETPEGIEEAAEIFLRVLQNRMGHSSYRVVPAKIQRFVEFCGDIKTKELDSKLWKRWIAKLKRQAKKGEFSTKTIHINYNRAKEFIVWLEDREALKPWPMKAPAQLF